MNKIVPKRVIAVVIFCELCKTLLTMGVDNCNIMTSFTVYKSRRTTMVPTLNSNSNDMLTKTTYANLIIDYGKDCIVNTVGTYHEAKDCPLGAVIDLLDTPAHDWQTDC